MPVTLTLSTIEIGLLSEDLLSRGRQLRMRVTGKSMEPSISDGDTILIERLTTRPRIGDILLWKTPPGKIIVHRVVLIFPGFLNKVNRRFLMQGDACIKSDGWITDDQVLGRVIAKDIHGQRMLPTAIPIWHRIIRLFPGILFLYLQKLLK